MATTQPIILALDVPSKEEALSWVQRMAGTIGVFKVGMQLFYRYGPDLVGEIHDLGGDVFLDLKLHDIPNTVGKACESLAPLAPRFLTIHTSGGLDMLTVAQSVFQNTQTRLLGVTALTSLDRDSLLAVYPNLEGSSSDWAIHLAGLASQAGLYGVVCSAWENRRIHERWGNRLALVNPGIRLDSGPVHDQKRVMPPQEALQEGATYLVMGRPILQSPDPVGTVRQLLESLTDEARLPS